MTANYKERPQEVGPTLIDLVRQWPVAAKVERHAVLDLAGSFSPVFSCNGAGFYRLHQFSLQLSNPKALSWYFPVKTIKGFEVQARHINGDDGEGRIFE